MRDLARKRDGERGKGRNGKTMRKFDRNRIHFVRVFFFLAELEFSDV